MNSKVFRISIFLAVMIVFLATSDYMSYAGKHGNAPQVVKGIIQENRYPTIRVNNKYYDIGSAPIIYRAEKVGSGVLAVGKWVRLTLQDGQVVNVEIIEKPAAG